MPKRRPAPALADLLRRRLKILRCDPTPAHVTRIKGIAVAQKPRPDGGADAVRPDQGRAGDPAAISEPDLDAVRSCLVDHDLAAGPQDPGAERFQQDPLQRRAMDGDRGSPQQGLDLAEIGAAEKRAVPSPDAGNPDRPAGRHHRPVEADAAQREDGVRLEGDAGAELPDLRSALQDLDRQSGLA